MAISEKDLKAMNDVSLIKSLVTNARMSINHEDHARSEYIINIQQLKEELLSRLDKNNPAEIDTTIPDNVVGY